MLIAITYENTGIIVRKWKVLFLDADEASMKGRVRTLLKVRTEPRLFPRESFLFLAYRNTCTLINVGMGLKQRCHCFHF